MWNSKHLNNVPEVVELDDPILLNHFFLWHGRPLYTARSYRWNVHPACSADTVLQAVATWAYERSNYKPSSIVLERIILDYSGGNDMARPKKEAKVQDKQAPEKFKGFINIRLGEDDVAALEVLFKKPNLRELVDFLLDCGKLSISFNKDTYNVTTVLVDGDHAGYGISSYASEYIQALVVQAYKLDRYGDVLADFVTSTPNRPSFG